MRAHVTQERPARKAQSADVVVLTASICNAAGGPFLSRRSEAPLQVRSVGGSVSRLHCTTAQVLRSGARSPEGPGGGTHL